VIAFDVGPANALIDGVVAIFSEGRESMDRDGARARRGGVDEALLARLLDDDFLGRPPPKSTGRERYGTEQAEALVGESRSEGRTDDDLVATLVAFTVQAIARARRDFIDGPVDRLLVGGGGVDNPARGGDGVRADGPPHVARNSQPPTALHGREPRRGVGRDLARKVRPLAAKLHSSPLRTVLSARFSINWGRC